MKGCVVTLTPQDYEWPEEEEEQRPRQEYTEGEISEALANRTLTEDQGWYLHTHNISWQIQVQRGG